MTKLTTHCLDTFSGKPAKGVKSEGNLITLKSKAKGGSGKVQLEGWKEN